MLANRVRLLGIAPNAQWTFDHFPQLGRAAEGLAWHLTDRVLFPFPFPIVSKTPLLDCCLKTAFEWMHFRLEKPGATARDIQTVFLAGLLYHIPEIIHVTVNHGSAHWDPFNDEALGDWLPRHPGATVGARDVVDDALLALRDQEIRMAILNRMFPASGVGQLDAKLAQILLPPDDFHPPRG